MSSPADFNHGGEECAEYCSQNFHSHLLHHLDREDDLGLVLEKSFHDVNRHELSGNRRNNYDTNSIHDFTLFYP